MRQALVILVFLLYTHCALANTATQATFVFAADMPNISDPTSGRYAELATLLNQQRQQQPEVFFIFGGGSIGPSALATFDQGSHIIDILNSVEPDVMGVTKREFSFFEDELSLRAYEAAFPLVISNVTDTRTNQDIDGVAHTVLIKKSQVTLGVISLLHERVVQEYLLKNVLINEPLQAIQQHAKRLRQQGADIILLHCSYPFEFLSSLLSSNVVNLVFLSDSRLNERYRITNNFPSNLITLRHPGSAVVTALQVTQDTVSVVNSTEVELAQLTPDVAVNKQVDAYQQRLNRLLSIEIGVWQSDTSTNRKAVRSEENGFANFITDAMLDFSGADLALLNGGSIRGDSNYKAGSAISRKTIATELPFLSKLKVVTVSGADIMKALEIGLSQYEYIKGGFPHVSGLEVVFNSNLPSGSRLESVSFGGEKLNPDKHYKLATSDFLAGGGDGYSILAEANAHSESDSFAPLISELVVQAIINQRSVPNNIDGRIINKAK